MTLKCIYCGKEIKHNEDFVDLKIEGCIHSSCLEELNDEVFEVSETMEYLFEEDYKWEDVDD